MSATIHHLPVIPPQAPSDTEAIALLFAPLPDAPARLTALAGAYGLSPLQAQSIVTVMAALEASQP